MALLPRIQSPCPLSATEQSQVGDHCKRCDTRVQRLDDRSEADRRTLMEQAKGPICVSYRIPLRRAAAMAGVVGLLSSGFVMADAPGLPPPQRVDPGNTSGQAPLFDSETLDLIFVGSIERPMAVDWVDESGLPELPIEYVDPEAE